MPIYNSLFDLIATYIFGSVDVGSYQELVTILISTLGTLALVALPFVVVYWCCSLIFNSVRF